ncbi:MAG: hypothetical protein HGA78_10255, partial [Nitrospirales bacterium]|nr:hypothetical protein [Nitrospirales bacterium]
MKRTLFFALSLLLLFAGSTIALTATPAAAATSYVVIGWNDLGMHCISPSFKEMAILPPYNTLMVQLLQKGNPP